MDLWLRQVGDIVVWCLVVCFALAALLSFYRFLRIRLIKGYTLRQNGVWEPDLRQLTFLLVGIPLLGRALDMAVWHDGYFWIRYEGQSPLQMVIGSFPNYALFSLYSFLYASWVYLSRKAVRHTSRSGVFTARVYIICNILVYALWLAYMIAYAVIQDDKKRKVVHSCEFFFACVLVINSAIFYMIYNCIMKRSINTENVSESLYEYNVSKRTASSARSMELLRIVFTTCLVLKSCFMLVDRFTPENELLSFIFRIFLNTLCEFVPAIFTIVTQWSGVPYGHATYRNTSSSEAHSLLSEYN